MWARVNVLSDQESSRIHRSNLPSYSTSSVHSRQLQYEYVTVCVGDQIMRPDIADEMMAQYVSIGHESLQLGWQRSFSHLDRGSVSMSEARKWL